MSTWRFGDVTVRAPRRLRVYGLPEKCWTKEAWARSLCGCGGDHPYWDCKDWDGTWRPRFPHLVPWEKVPSLRSQHKSVAEIAKATGISKRKLYKHWRSA